MPINLSKTLKFLPFLLLLFSGRVNSQEGSCNCNVDSLKDLYSVGQFEALKNNLKCCLSTKNKLSINGASQVRELLALTAIAEDSIELANSYLNEIITSRPNYIPQNQNLVFQELFYKVKKENLKVVVSSVSKRPEDIKTAPAVVEIIEAKDIIARGYVDLIDLLSDIQGFEISKTYSLNYSNVYQLGYRQDETKKTLIMIDGIEENDLYSNFAYLSRQYPISNIKAVEILYGPSSTMYGPRAFLGTINIITYSPKEEAGNYFENPDIEKGNALYFNGNFSRGSFNSYDLDFTLGNSAKDKKIYYQLTARYFSSDEHDMSSEAFFDYDQNDLDRFEYDHLSMSFNSESERQRFLNQNNMDLISPYYNAVPNGLEISELGIQKASQYDEAAYLGKVNGSYLNYSNHTEDFFVGAKISINDLMFGFRAWKRSEGLNHMQDLDIAPSRNGSVWAPTNQTIYVKYNHTFNEKLSFSLQTSLKNHSLGKETNRVNFIPFGNPKALLNLSDLVNYNNDSSDENRTNHGWRNQFFYYQTLQGRNEIRFYYNSSNLNITFGTDHRMTFNQGDYFYHRNFNTDFISESAYKENLSNSFAQELGLSPSHQTNNNIYKVNEVGSFLQANLILDEKLHLNGGFRYDRQMIGTNIGYEIIEPRLGVTFTSERITIKSNYSKGFQNVTLFDRYSTGGDRIPNPNLKPEGINYLDFSLLGSNETERLNWSLTAFAYTVDNAISQTDTPNGKSQNVNEGMYEVLGGMMSVKYRTKSFRFDLNGTYFDPFVADVPLKDLIQDELSGNSDSIEKEERIGDIASFRANAGLTVFLNNESFNSSINLRANYVSEKIVGPTTTQSLNLGLNNTGLIPEYFVVNSNFIFGFEQLPALKFSISANNLLNSLYYHPGIKASSGSFQVNPRNEGQSYTNWTSTSLFGKTVPYAPQRRRHFNFKIILDL